MSSKSVDTDIEIKEHRITQWLSECPTVFEDAQTDVLSVSSDTDLSKLKSVSVAGSPCKTRRSNVVSPAKSEKQTVITSFFSCKESVTPSKEVGRGREEVPSKKVKVSAEASKAAWDGILQKMKKGAAEAETPSFPDQYKLIKGTTFVVDAFSYGYIKNVSRYFLTHFHYDHYMGLQSQFSKPIYCSKITANLVALKIGVNSLYINVLALNKPVIVEGVEVTALEANHCPGAVMLLFKLPDGTVVLHTGDFRANKQMEQYHALQKLSVDYLYLDTTFCDSQYDFPSQDQVIETAVKLSTQYYSCNKKTLFVVGSYMIGKERLYEAIAKELDLKIWVDTEKRQILRCLENPALVTRLVEDPRAAGLHVLPMGKIKVASLHRYLTEFEEHFTSILAFKPTGWEYNGDGIDIETLPSSGNKNVSVYAIPYSEHSSYGEMERFVRFLDPKFVIPTVNADSIAGQKKILKIVASWKLNKTGSPGKKARQTKLSGFLPKKTKA